MHLFRATCAIGVSALLLGGLSAAPAQATLSTSTGVPCTVVGTAGADVLVGTALRDVICGRGGDDVIRAGGGRDLVDAGPGRDRVVAGPGDDRVLGASGADKLDGGDGSDRVSGGDGADVLGGDGGVDTLSGGDGEDTIEGGGSGDDLSGQLGDDVLTGDGGADDLDGGAGTNFCIVDAADESVRCKYDEDPAVMVETRIDPVSVDVTNSSAEVILLVHATDDTGVEDVQVQLYNADYSVSVGGPPAELISGNDRDGWWQTTFEVSRYTPAADLQPTVILRDRLDRQTFAEDSPARLHVIDDNPDTETPRLALVAPLDPEPVDVRSHGVDVTVTVRATDNLSGVDRVDLCLSRPDVLSYSGGVCQDGVPKASGTIRDGLWTAVLRVPRGAPGGEWNVTTYAYDRVYSGGGVRWMGPDAYKMWVDNRWCCNEAHAFPDGAGRLTVIGGTDSTPAWTDSVTLTPTEVDTFTADASTHVRVHALDAAEEGVTAVVAVLVSDSDSATAPQFTQVDLTRTEGTEVDGTWEGDLLMPQGTPPGSYHVLVFVGDIAHSRSYVGTGYPHAAESNYILLADDPHVVVVARQ